VTVQCIYRAGCMSATTCIDHCRAKEAPIPLASKENSICGKCGYEMSAHDVAWGSATCPPGKAVVDRGRLPRYVLTADANGQPVMHASPRGPWVAWTDLHRTIGDEPSWVEPVPSPVETRDDGWLPISTVPNGHEEFEFWVEPKLPGESYVDTSGTPIVSTNLGFRHIGKYRTWGSLSKATHWRRCPSPPKTGAEP
jgi:hypothetical protein